MALLKKPLVNPTFHYCLTPVLPYSHGNPFTVPQACHIHFCGPIFNIWCRQVFLENLPCAKPENLKMSKVLSVSWKCQQDSGGQAQPQSQWAGCTGAMRAQRKMPLALTGDGGWGRSSLRTWPHLSRDLRKEPNVARWLVRWDGGRHAGQSRT